MADSKLAKSSKFTEEVCIDIFALFIYKVTKKIIIVAYDQFKYNLFIVTNEDIVYGFGQNGKESLCLGHSLEVSEPQVIKPLSDLNIKSIIFGEDYNFGTTSDNKFVIWYSYLEKNYTGPIIFSKDINIGSITTRAYDIEIENGRLRFGQIKNIIKEKIENNKKTCIEVDHDNNIITGQKNISLNGDDIIKKMECIQYIDMEGDLLLIGDSVYKKTHTFETNDRRIGLIWTPVVYKKSGDNILVLNSIEVTVTHCSLKAKLLTFDPAQLGINPEAIRTMNGGFNCSLNQLFENNNQNDLADVFNILIELTKVFCQTAESIDYVFALLAQNVTLVINTMVWKIVVAIPDMPKSIDSGLGTQSYDNYRHDLCGVSSVGYLLAKRLRNYGYKSFCANNKPEQKPNCKKDLFFTLISDMTRVNCLGQSNRPSMQQVKKRLEKISNMIDTDSIE